MRLDPRSIGTWAAGFGLLVAGPIAIFVVAPPDLNLKGGDNDSFFALLILMAGGSLGLVGCALAWQVRSAVRARLVGRLIAPGEAFGVVPFLAFGLWWQWNAVGNGESDATTSILVVAVGLAEGCALRLLSVPVARAVARQRGALVGGEPPDR